jgi:SIR2-like domain
LADVPAGLLQAVSSDGGGRLAVVIGAGCSHEPPTDVPLAGTLSTDAARKLVMDGVMVEGECPDPGDLAALASLVFKKTGSQHALISRFPLARLKMAKPNLGYRLLVALMYERAVSYVLSLNFDLAVQNASAELGTPIDVVDTAGQPIPTTPTLVHLHGSVNGSSESLVLRKETIDAAWRGNWEQVVANQILAAPNVLFVGLGSAASVLSETVSMISDAVGGVRTFYQADVVAYGDSDFANKLDVPMDRYIRGGWSAVMTTLANRLAYEQVHTLSITGAQVLRDNQCPEEEVAGFQALVGRKKGLSLLALGKMRSYARLDTKRAYIPRTAFEEELIAEPMAKLALICAKKGLFARPTLSGLWSLERDGRSLATALLASGGGVRRLAALEPNMRHICSCISEGSPSGPDIVLVAGTMPDTAPIDHVDIIADEDRDDLIGHPGLPAIFLTSAANIVNQVEHWLNAT